MKRPTSRLTPGDAANGSVIIRRSVGSMESECERILRTLPEWFGIEESLLEYVRSTSRLPTFVAEVKGQIVAFASLIEHFPTSWEVHCIAVDAAFRGKGIGMHLHEHIEAWLVTQGVAVLQVKTIAATHPSREYAQTRGFYVAAGYVPVEIFPRLWAAHLPVLQMIKMLRHSSSPSNRGAVARERP
jgi:GNAT superfamily N-acetyltransferase